MPTPESVDKFEAALEKKGISHNITIYKDASHAFVNKHAHEDSSMDGHQQASDAWQQIENFLNQTLDSSLPSRHSRQTSSVLFNDVLEAAAVPQPVSLHVSMYNRLACALKC